MYYSQIGQDKYYIENISKGEKYGTFLDIGAHDGIHTSNTAALEFEYGWKGVCIEANPELAEKAIKNRPNSTVINCAAWSSNTEVAFEVPLTNINNIQGDLLSRISDEEALKETNKKYFRNHFAAKTKKFTVPARTITSLIEELYELPVVFHYVSLDVEGAELEVLKGIDFDKIKIKFMSIEHGNRKGMIPILEEYLTPFGFKTHRVNKWDIEFETI
jgi:FkbM family methyltransferase